MSVALILGLAAIAVAIGLGVYVLIGQPTQPAGEIASSVKSASPLGHASRPGDSDELAPLYDRLRGIAAKLSPGDYAERLQRRLDLAGNPRGLPADRVLAYKGIGLVMGLLVGAVLGLKHGAGVVFFPLIGGALGFFVPDILVRNMGEKRQIELQKGLPDALDMMTVCVEAGLGFDAALMRVALNLSGPTAEEWARVLQEMQFGKSRTEALRGLVERTDVSEIRTFVSSLIQSNELGISIGHVLREQAKEMRVRRRQRAEEKAQKLPVKILLPLITCLLPAMFVVILGPAILHIFDMLSKLNTR